MINFWNGDLTKEYNRDQLINFAKDDIEILVGERIEIMKILNLFNAIEINFNGEEI
jgi:hypothetical protein